MNHLIWLLPLLLLGCPDSARTAGKYEGHWEGVSGEFYLLRFENREVICYGNSQALSCHWKGTPP